MIEFLKKSFKHLDWTLFVSAVLLCVAGLTTMNSFSSNIGFGQNISHRQFVWLLISVTVFFIASAVDWRFLKNSKTIIILFGLSVGILTLLFLVGSVFNGARSWFSFGLFSFQPADFAELVVILILAKYFSRRHIEIARVRHIFVSGFYVFVIAFLVLLQPDFGSTVIFFLLWLSMVLISGISKKHLLLVFLVAMISVLGLWLFVFKPYQKERIVNFLHPLTDIQDSGYNAYQSTIAVGSGQIFGKGIGYGTQSKLQYLPEYETDFIFASFAEEWGFFGVILLFLLYAILFSRMISISFKGETNFEILFGIGLTMLFTIHSFINIGMNIGVLPVTGNTLPFLSYGGSHLLTEFLGLGILMGMKKYGRTVHKSVTQNEMVGV